jgi:phosphoglycerate dehydrogenase-like enzyme
MSEPTAGTTRVVVLDDWQRFFTDSPRLERLRERAEVTVHTDRAPSREALVERLAEADVVITNRERTRFDAELFAALPRLRLVAQTGDGTPNIDLAAAAARGVQVANTPGASTTAMVELTIGLMVAWLRRFAEQEQALRAGEWPRPDGLGLFGKTLGIVGFGRLGRATSRAALFFGMRVVAWSRRLTPAAATAAGIEYRDLGSLLAESDVVSLHVRLTPETRAMITAEHLARMKPSALFVNTARGAIVDEAALAEALRAGRLAGAALDVYEQEPLPVDSPLRSLPNVLLTAHCGGMTDTAFDQFVAGCVENVLAFLDSGRPLNPVQAPVALPDGG